MTEHHAIVCIADTLAHSSVPEKYKTQSSDISHIVCDRFSINDARQLSNDALQKPVHDPCRVFVLVTQKLPEESQNALLKLFEEPPEQTRFFLVIPHVGLLIPTLRSRVQIDSSREIVVPNNEIFSAFLADTYAGRMKIILDCTKKKDLVTIEALYMGAEMLVDKNTYDNKDLLRTIIYLRGYAKTPGSSTKMLLEELALMLPQAKKI